MPRPGWAPDAFKSKTTWLGVTGVLAGASTAVVTYLETGDWKAAAMAAGFALHYGIQMTQRDTEAKGFAMVNDGQQVVAAANIQAAEEIKKQVTRLTRLGGRSGADTWSGSEWDDDDALGGWDTDTDGDDWGFGDTLLDEGVPEPGPETATPGTRRLDWGDG